MRILGIDPGTHRTGWAVLDGSSSKPLVVAYGAFDYPPGTKSQDYLQWLYRDLSEVIKAHEPALAAIESLFAQRNVKTVVSVAQARGLILFTLGQKGLDYLEMSPNTVKAAVAGSGSAVKSEVQRMVSLLLHLDTSKLLDDTADALAIALTAQATYRKAK